MHITLIPPWYEKNIDLIKNKLKSLEGSFLNFKIQFNLVEYGPNKFNPRLIWLVGNTPKELLNLRLKFLEVLNQKPENREFKTHLTLARFNPDLKFNLPEIKKNIFWEENIKEFILIESRLLKTGAEYDVLEKIKLQKND
ncbi:MAG: 2'-5' RNA ligase family protein [Minisyncoccia bacterium]